MDTMLLYHKYMPKKLEELSFNKKVTYILSSFANVKDDIMQPNLIIYGPPGSGKYTRAILYLNEIYKIDCKKKLVFELLKIDKSQIAYLKGLCHIEIFPTGSQKDDDILFNNVIKEISTSINIYNQKFQTIIVHNTDYINLKTFNALRVLIEKKYKTIRFIFLIKNVNKIPDIIRSSCVCIRNPAPTIEDITNICTFIIKQENELNNEYISNINEELIKKNNRNLKQILLNMQIDDKKIDLYKYIKTKPTTKIQLEDFRKCLYDAYLSNISATELIKNILFYHSNNLNNIALIKEVAKIEHSMQLGNEKLIYLESIFWYMWKINS